MTDDQLLEAFEAGTLPNATFHHLDHLRVAWICLRRDGSARGEARVATGLSRFAAAHGVPGLYHETLTRFWVRLVDHVAQATPGADRFEALLDRYPALADKTLPHRHWRADTLAGAAARTSWIEPDLAPIP